MRLYLFSVSVLFLSVLLLVPSVSVSGWYCGIGSSASGTSDGNPSGGTWKSPAQHSSASSLVWNLAVGNPYQNSNGENSAHNSVEWLTGCVIPAGQTSFITSFQWQPIVWESGPGITLTYAYGSPHSDRVFLKLDNNNLTFTVNSSTASKYEVFNTGDFALTKGSHLINLTIQSTDYTSSTPEPSGCPWTYQFKVNCTQAHSGANGDPQFTGFLGQSYQVHGLSGADYNIISTPTLQYNAHFNFLTSGACRTGTECYSHPGNYFGSVSLQIKDSAGSVQRILIDSGSVTTGLTVKQNEDQIWSIGTDQFTRIGAYNLSFPNQFEFIISSEEFNMRIQNSDMFVNQDVSIGRSLMTQIAEFKLAARGTNSTAAVELETKLPHGILGQTWQLKTYQNRWKYIQGQLYDYMLSDGVMGTDFKYNRF